MPREFWRGYQQEILREAHKDDPPEGSFGIKGTSHLSPIIGEWQDL
jgi:hypothetical protein